ncbi:unnamed protein product [Prorocentrum cordatum]|uniref:Uncharacterized protein n=1 Tax=Prorocentrum cordatum TaxID=2364126 RepID=A0ABN9V328_9DINO|nr:unnamed protein product [Polarella glacialis]
MCQEWCRGEPELFPTVLLIGYFGRDPGLAVSVRFGNPIIAGRWLHHSVPRQPPGDPPVGRIRRPLGLCRAEPQDSLTFSRLPETKGLFTGISKLRPGNKFTSPELLPRIELTSDSAMSNHTSDSESTSDLFEDSPKFSKAGMIFHRTSGIASEECPTVLPGIAHPSGQPVLPEGTSPDLDGRTGSPCRAGPSQLGSELTGRPTRPHARAARAQTYPFSARRSLSARGSRRPSDSFQG